MIKPAEFKHFDQGLCRPVASTQSVMCSSKEGGCMLEILSGVQKIQFFMSHKDMEHLGRCLILTAREKTEAADKGHEKQSIIDSGGQPGGHHDPNPLKSPADNSAASAPRPGPYSGQKAGCQCHWPGIVYGEVRRECAHQALMIRRVPFLSEQSSFHSPVVEGAKDSTVAAMPGDGESLDFLKSDHIEKNSEKIRDLKITKQLVLVDTLTPMIKSLDLPNLSGSFRDNFLSLSNIPDGLCRFRSIPTTWTSNMIVCLEPSDRFLELLAAFKAGEV